MQVVLIMFRTGGEHRSFSVSRSTTTIGRREDCDLRIPVGDVSRKHCRLVMTDDNVRIQDLGSSNGTYVNGERVSDAYLNPGDTVGVGPVHFVIQIDGVPPEDEVVAPAAAAAAGESAAGGTAAALALAASQAEPEVVDDPGLLEEVEGPAAADEVAVHEASPVDADLADDLMIEGVAAHEALAPEALAPEALAHEASSDGKTIDEVPADEVPASQDAAFDLTTEADPDAVTTDDLVPEDPAAADPAGEWDFLVEDAEAHRSGADLHVDLDSTGHGSSPHA